jgi:polyisoprenoid-binding protein YceI
MRNALVALLFVTACENPAADKSKAEVTEAKPTNNAPAAAGAETITLGPDTSAVEWTGSKVTGSHQGGFKAWTGKLDYTAGAPEKSRLEITIDTASIWTDDEKLVGHLKSPDFFDVAKFPKATFVSTEIKAGGDKGASHTVVGNLTLHGVTKSISFPVTFKENGADITATSEFAINRKDFGIVYPGAPDDLIRDEVVLRLKVNAKKKS